MPDGYLVSLGSDQTLTIADAISDPFTTFTTVQSLGTGEWAWTGDYLGTAFYNETETGEYFLAADGNVYFVPDLGGVTTVTGAQAVTAPDFSALNIVLGTQGDDLINGAYVDINGNVLNAAADNADLVFGFSGNDNIRGLAGDDTIYGGSGDDTVRGGSGDDLLFGDTPGGSIESLNWFAEGTDGDGFSNFTQNTGDIDVTVTFVDLDDNSAGFTVETSDEIYTESGDSFSDHSSLLLSGDGTGSTSSTTIEFAAATGADVQNDVTNVTFRINDIDFGSGAHQDQLTITATDDSGAAVDVTLTPSSTGATADTVSGNTITAGEQSDSQNDADGSVLVEIAGPVSEVVIEYGNIGSGFQLVWVSDVFFETLPLSDGNDQLRGGSGDDTIFGQGGDDLILGNQGSDSLSGGDGADSIRAAQGDTVDAGAGDDTIGLYDLAETGTGAIFIDGGEGDEADGDTLDLRGQADRSTLNLTSDTPGDLAGTVEMLDGSLVTFSNIENIICFTPGTMIATASGQRAIETLREGDLIVTRDSGLQALCWIGSRDVQAKGRLAPIEVSDTLLQDATAPLLVSPQHRILWSGSRAQMLFGDSEVLVSAKHLIDHPAVNRREGGTVTYMHLMLDRHEVIYANGVATESFFPGDCALTALTERCREQMFTQFPELRSNIGAFGGTARQCLLRHEARLLA